MLLSKHNKLIGTTKVLVKCDFSISSCCKKEWETSYRVILKTRSKRNGLDCCNLCATKISNSGSNNPSFKYEKKEDIFEEINSEIKAYLLGWIASDGSIRARTLHIELHKDDIQILKLFQKSISPHSTISCRKNRNTVYITISSQKMVNDICKQLNVAPGNKQNKVRLPNLDKKLIFHFLRGFLEGDGWIAVKNSKYIMCGIATICPQLQNDIMNYSKTNNIICYSNSKGVEWYGKNSLKILDVLYSNAQFILDRKYKIYYNWKVKYGSV